MKKLKNKFWYYGNPVENKLFLNYTQLWDFKLAVLPNFQISDSIDVLYIQISDAII
jgi:hypothetical protein